MKSFSPEAQAALAAGDVLVSGAVRIDTSPDPILLWGGHGEIALPSATAPGETEIYKGIGDRGVAQVSGGQLGGTEQGAQLVLSGVDTDIVAATDLSVLRGRGVILWRLIFNGAGSQLLHAAIYLRGRTDRANTVDVPGGTSTLTLGIEGASRGLGRRSERMRSDADQRLIDPDDTGLRRVSYAGEKTIYFGGKPPVRAGVAFQGSGPGQTPDSSGGGGGGRDITDVNTDVVGR